MSNSSASWQIPQPVEVLPEILQAARGNLLLAQSLMRKGLTKSDIARAFLDPNCYSPSPPSELPNLPKGVERISQAIRSGEKIGVWGDFDADGLTATSLLVSGLRSLGTRISFHVPVRSTESHGVSLSSLKKFLDGGIQLLLTCDTGISAIDAVAYANLRGVDTIITDHHTPPPVLPAAHAIINPHLLPHPHPLENLCGVGCAYKLIEDLFGKLAPSLNPAIFHDLVAIGTIADLALLTDDNRFLVQKGLTELRANPRLAILAMLDRAEISHNLLTEEHVSFWIAPQLNAIGRLDDANPVIEFLLTQDPEHAELFASRLKAMNDRRKMIGDQVFKAAQSQIEKDRSLLDTPALILHHPDWPSGVIGIVASRLVAQYRRPVIMLTGKPGEDIRGSARSVEGLDITKTISSQQALLQGFGGHSMAAGFSLPYEKLSEFRRSIQQILEQNPVVKQPSTTLQVDAILPLQEITLELVEMLDILAPYGPGNKPLTFICQNLTLLSHTLIGKNRDHLQLIVEDQSGTTQKVLWWQGAGFPLPEGNMDMAFTVRASNFKGQRQVQIEWIDAFPIPPGSLPDLQRKPQFEMFDLRKEPFPLEIIKSFEVGNSIIWQEGEHVIPQSVTRYQFHTAQILIILSIPPGLDELRQAIDIVKPQRIYFCGTNPGVDHPRQFKILLAKLVNYSLNHNQGIFEVTKTAAKISHKEITIRKGLAWLAANGSVAILSETEKQITLSKEGIKNKENEKHLDQELSRLLIETSAFRSFYLRAAISQLL